MWYLPTDIIKNHFLDSMLYLRGEPPLPQLFLGILMKLFGWPFTTPVDSMLLSLMCLFTAWLMYNILVRYHFSSFFSTGIASLWCIYPACLGVEIQAFPTAFYEALPSFFFVVSLWLCISYSSNKKIRTLWWFGVAGAILSMSRSTLSWIFILPIFISLLLPGNRLRIVIGCMALIIQILWSLKNFAVYGQYHLETASDVGQNLVSTLLNTGHFDDFYHYSISNNPNDTFIADGLPCFLQGNMSCVAKTLPDVKSLDDTLAARLPSQEPLYGETYFMRGLSQKVKPLYFEYLLHHPLIAVDMLRKSYALFWGNIYWQVGYIKGLDADPIILGVNATMEKLKLLNIAGIHLLSFPLFVLIIARFAILRRKPHSWQIGFLYAFLAFFYVAIVSSLGDHGENARYRTDVEPLIWLLPFITFRCLQQIFQRPLQNQDTSA
jgi:hypothetical protein